MNLLIIAKLTPEKLLSKLRPFIDNPDIRHIYILRDKPFPVDSNKIDFTPTPKISGMLRHIEKISIVRNHIKTHQIDVIISYLLPPHGYIAWTVAKITGVKWIHAIIAGHREIWVNGKFMTKVHLRMLRSASLISVMGGQTKDYLVKNGMDSHKISIIPNAIDAEEFLPPPQKEIEYDILYAGRIDANKNLPLLLRALVEVVKKHPSIKVCIAGDGDKLEEAVTMANDYHLTEIVDFLGHVNHENIKVLFHQSKIFVLTSRGEGIPMALLEAMFCGLACVSTNVGEIGDIIKNEWNGFLLPNTEDDKALAKYLIELLEDESLYLKISKNAPLIRKQYSFDNVYTLWGNALKTVQTTKYLS